VSQNITISVSEAGSPASRTLEFKIVAGGEVLVEQKLTPVESSQVREMAGQYISMFSESCNASQDYLSILGDGLFHIFFEAGWRNISSKILEGGTLIIASEIPEVLQLPWEYLRLEGLVVGFDERFCIIRMPKVADGLSASRAEIAPGPLRVLFVACDPLDYEQEEQWMLQAAEGQDMVLQICDEGTLEELKETARAFRPHLIHLVVQGRVKEGQAFFSMLDGKARQRLHLPLELADALKGCGTQCVIFGGCQREAPSSLYLLSQNLVRYLPMAVSWNGKTSLPPALYRSLAKGRSISDALSAARLEMQTACLNEGEICAIPVFFAASDQQTIFDAQKRADVAVAPWTMKKSLRPLPGLSEGHAHGFVDRRLDLQRLTFALLEGTARTLIITGPRGVGKSSLATMLAERLASSGYFILPVYSSQNNPVSATRLLESFVSLLAKSGQVEAAQRLRDSSRSAADRQKSMLEELNRGKFLILLDGLDPDEKTGKIEDPDLAEFYLQAQRELDKSRMIITSRSLALPLSKRAWEWPLTGLSNAAFIKCLLQDEIVAERYRRGEVRYEDLQRLCCSVAGSPACLAQMAVALRMDGMTGDCEEVLEKTSALLSSKSRSALSMAAVYSIAVNIAALAAVSGRQVKEAAEFVCDWKRLKLVYQAGELWAVPSYIRDKLLAVLTPEERRAAQKAAAEFLRVLAEEGKAAELGLSRLDLMLEARGHYIAADDLKAARIVSSRISSYLERRGYHSQLIWLNQELLNLERHAETMNWIARGYLGLGDLINAQEWYGRALEMGPDAAASLGLGMIHLSQGRDEQALEALQKAQKLQETLGDLRGQAETLQTMALLDLRRSDYEAARSKVVKALEMVQHAGDIAGFAEAQYKLAAIDMERGDLQLAREEFQKALQLKREIGERRGEAAVLHNLGQIESQVNDKEAAVKNFSGALRIYQELADKPGEAGAFFQLGALSVQRDKIPEGLRLMALAAIVLRSIKSDEVKNVEPLVERLAAQLNYSQEQFMVMVQEVLQSYVTDKGWGLVKRAFVEK